MPWAVNQRRMRYNRELTPTEERRLDEFVYLIGERNMHPSEAARQTSFNARYEKLDGDQSQIRLSNLSRLSFWVREAEKLVEFRQVGA